MEAETLVFDAQSKTVADNVLLLAVARVSMALSLPALGMVAWLSGQWLEQKFDAQDAKITAQATAADNQSDITTKRIETVERTAAAKVETVEKQAFIAVEQAARVNDRLIAVETKQTQDSAAAERFQNATLTRLDRMQDSIVSMSNAVAALTATLQANAQRSSLKGEIEAANPIIR